MTLVQTTQTTVPLPTCPLCHTVDQTITPDALGGGAEWTCTRCGQTWSAERLARAAAYAQYEAVH